MQRQKPYRPRPTPAFMNIYDLTLNMRLYLVQENGPTKLVLEDPEHKKFKIQIGQEVTCSCGGGKAEHCAHTIQDGDPLLWQLSYIDSEISRILQNRMRAQHEITSTRRRDVEKPIKDGKKVDKRDKVKRMELDPEETCCVCYEEMKETENLTFCKFGCGRNIHIDCIEVWVKHKISVAQKITCPLCRIDWGPNALEDLKEETKNYRDKLKEKNSKKSKTDDQVDRSFKCSCCKRKLTYEAKLQCIQCADVEICKLCFSGRYHDHHDFMIRPSPDKDWEPAFRGNASSYNEEYVRLMTELQSREIRPEDYEMLLQLEQSSNKVPLPKYLVSVFDKANPPTEEYLSNSNAVCNFCSSKIEDKTKGLPLRNCHHYVHKNCLEDMFRLKKSKCQTCQKVIADGFEKSLRIVRKKPKVDTKKKQLEETKVKVLQEIQERVQPISFGIEGVALIGNPEDQVDPRSLYTNSTQQFKIRQQGVKPNGKRFIPKGKVQPETNNQFDFRLNGRLDPRQKKGSLNNQITEIQSSMKNSQILVSLLYQVVIILLILAAMLNEKIQEYKLQQNISIGINGNGLMIGNEFGNGQDNLIGLSQNGLQNKKGILSQRPPRKQPISGLASKNQREQLRQETLQLNAQAILNTNGMRINNLNTSQHNTFELPPLSSSSRRSTQMQSSSQSATGSIQNISQNRNSDIQYRQNLIQRHQQLEEEFKQMIGGANNRDYSQWNEDGQIEEDDSEQARYAALQLQIQNRIRSQYDEAQDVQYSSDNDGGMNDDYQAVDESEEANNNNILQSNEQDNDEY
ncbi:e3 ubiquitin-protein ligase zswim2-like [Stylonychia lemnae]|uniref:E3 ubiquitin-protein ligase zswim2-like n=1 Tax=Stylonychia lemnae TaxID=5949 RepID=A0A078B2V7_STYLE|nr:e3 ubiquitin-protein ligase zswim2-like [Stylonychia lemnae]|eukprot:CDW88804.1 e3 ubiquitin-protein ligase zswim2-like [Stylonychia lemnae]